MDAETTPAADQTFLVVDDELVQRLVMSRMARKMGYAASAAASLEEAAALLQREAVDVVVLDLSLRDRDGIELLREIARLGRDPLIIFVSGFNERVREAAARLAIALGLRVAGTLAKPVQFDQLTMLVHEAPRLMARGLEPRRVSPTPAMLDAGLRAGEVRCLFQPKVSLVGRKIRGFEALARWYSPKLGIVGPDVFVPMAERSGLVDRMTSHVLQTALSQLHAWHAIDPDLEMAVNLSPLSLGDLALPEQIIACLEQNQVAADRLVLEVTESAVMADFIAAADILTRLRLRGVGISVDDFGTGHSTLLSLLRLPFSELKIDQNFVRGLLVDPDAFKIVRAVLSLAKSMDLHSVAEGIEDEGVAQRLCELGTDTGQGYLFARPLSAEAAAGLLRSQAGA